MPELPDVERFRRVVLAHVVNRPIVDVEVRNDTILRGISSAALTARLVGRTFGEPSRHGKWLTLPGHGMQLLADFGMTGAARWTTDEPSRDDDRLSLRLGDGCLVISDRRNLGTISLLTSGDDPETVTGPLGPDARTIGEHEFEQLLRASRRSLKATLMDQATIAGLGNMLTDEVLWSARTDPARRGLDLDQVEARTLHRRLRSVVSRSVRAGHIPRGPTWLSGQRRVDAPVCPRCRGPLEWRRVAGRSSLWCPSCQRDRRGQRLVD